MTGIKWIDARINPKEKCGWFIASIMPVNWDEATLEEIVDWMKAYGFTKLWYNADSIDKWYEPPKAHGSWEGVGDRILYWAECPKPKYCKEKPEASTRIKELWSNNSKRSSTNNANI